MGWRSRFIRKCLQLYAPVPRRTFQAFGIGAAKTGTTSLARVFARGYRVSHEPETRWTNDLAIRNDSGTISRDEVLARLHRRDRRMRLDLEVAHPLIYLADELVEAFPSALFLVTVREPRSWLVSRISYHDLRRTRTWQPYRRHFLVDRACEFLPGEESLRARGLVPLRTYLEQYEDHYRRVREFLPADRTLVVRTDRLDRELSEIAAFLGVPAGQAAPVHDNQLPERSPALAHLDPQFIDASIARWCPEVIRNWFPETADRYASARHPEVEGMDVQRPRGVPDPVDRDSARRTSAPVRRRSLD